MIVVEFRSPTLTTTSYTVAATLTVTGGTPTIQGAAQVIPTHALVETPTGIVSYPGDPEAWAAHLGRTPWCPFVIPVIVAGANTPATDPHQPGPVRATAAMAELADALPAAAPTRNRGYRPRKQGRRSGAQ